MNSFKIIHLLDKKGFMLKRKYFILKSRSLLILLLLTVFWGCKKEQIVEEIILASPSIEIVSAKQTALTTYEVVIQTDIGEGQEIKKAEVVFEDITVLTQPDIVKNINLNNEKKQTDTLILRTEYQNHDFNIQANLETNLYIYKSNPLVLRSKKNRFTVDILPNDRYSDLDNKIADFVNPGEMITFRTYFLNTSIIPKKIEVKLNKNILVEHSLDFENAWYGSDGNGVSGSIKIPTDIAPGVYEVYIYFDDIEFKTSNNIKVLKGEWEKIQPNFLGERRGSYAWFQKDDNLYIIGGNFSSQQLQRSPVWKYNLSTGDWESKNDFPHPGDVRYNKISPFNLKYKAEGYIVLQNSDTIELWKYNDNNDSWSFVTIYPGAGNKYLVSFIHNDKLYLGGGAYWDHPDNITVSDFWAYSFESDKWEQKRDIPMKYGFDEPLCSTTQNNEVYMFSYINELWQYLPDKDTWIKRQKFPGLSRMTSSLIERNNKLYLIGGTFYYYGYDGLKDCWEYSIESNSWELIAFLPDYYSNGVSFLYNNTVHVGLGRVLLAYGEFLEQNFYQLNI